MIEEIIKKDALVKLFPAGKENGIFADSESKKCGRGIIRKFVSDMEMEVEMEGEYFLEKKVCYAIYILSYEKVYLTYVYPQSFYSESGKSMVSLEIVSPIERLRRRMHQRVSCHSKLFFKQIPNENIASAKEQEAERPDVSQYEDTMVDISGGGIRFTTKRQVKQGEYLRVAFEIELDHERYIISALGQVVYAEKLRNEQDYFDIRMKYVGLSEKFKEQIIHFVFELERNG